MYRHGQLVCVVIFSLLIGACTEKERDDSRRNEMATVVEEISSRNNAESQEQYQEEEDRILKVGVVGPETGESSRYGERIVEGVSLAAEVFNLSGGLNGKPIEVIHYDNKDEQELTDMAIHDLVKKKVLAIFAAPTGWSAFSSTHIVNKTKTIFVAIGSRRNIDRSGPYVFRFSLPDEIAINELIGYAVNKSGYKKFALITASDYDYSLALSAHFRQAITNHGAQLQLVSDTYDTYTGQHDIPAIIKNLKKHTGSLHAVIYTGGGEEGALLVKEMARAGLKTPVIAGEDLHNNSYLSKGKRATRGTLLYASFAPDNEAPKVKKFIQAYKQYTGVNPDRFVALAYDSFMLVAQAVQKAGSTKSTLIRDAMLNIRYQGVTGDTHFTSEGSPIKHPFLYKAETDKSGEKFNLIRK